MKYVKMHGCGNDFVVVEEDKSIEYKGEIVRRLCDRHYGIGADGLIVISKNENELYKMNIYNSDGSMAKMCGNGIRCMAWYMYKHGMVKVNEWDIDTEDGIRRVYVNEENNEHISVDMGEAKFLSINPVVCNGCEVICISMGNSHAVIMCDSIESYNNYDWINTAKYIEKHPMFSEGTNVELICIKDAENILVRVWERGCGETLACGTGACAAYAAAYRFLGCSEKMNICMKGGTLQITHNKKTGRLILTGECELVSCGECYCISC